MIGFRSEARAAANTTFYFAGDCTDCTGVGRAELVLANYALGDQINADNFVLFHYEGTDLLAPFTINPSSNNFYQGSISTPLPGPQFVNIYGADLNVLFQSYTGGNWCVGNSCLLDFGPASLWSDVGPAGGVLDTVPASAVPEPLSLVLLASGVAMVGAMRRRQA